MLGGYLSLKYLENPDFTCWMCRKPRKYTMNLIIHGIFLILLLKLKLLATVRLQLAMGTFGRIQWVFKYLTYQCFTIKTCTFSKWLWTRKALADSQSRVNPVNYQLNEQEVWKNSGNKRFMSRDRSTWSLAKISGNGQQAQAMDLYRSIRKGQIISRAPRRSLLWEFNCTIF